MRRLFLRRPPNALPRHPDPDDVGVCRGLWVVRPGRRGARSRGYPPMTRDRHRPTAGRMPARSPDRLAEPQRPAIPRLTTRDRGRRIAAAPRAPEPGAR
ncbi:MAG: hypothetical protein MZU84_03415 [Sphingobacterium sp.]|nr:hypothetical protein [Sphingobacterium sp.]